VRFAPLRGFRDYPPPEAGARSELRRRMRAAARRCGYQELETPSLESLELFRVKSGEEISQQLWTFPDKAGRDVALVAETTPSLARVYVDRAKSEPLPVKWMTFARLWRYEEPQAGRTREFTQLNLDILGVPGVEAETDLLASAALVMDEAGAEGLYAFRLNDRHFAEGLSRRLGASDPGRFFHALDRRAKASSAEFQRELEEAGLAPYAVARLEEILDEAGPGVPAAQADRFLDRVESLELPPPGPDGIRRLRALSARLVSVGLGDRVVLNPTVVRGLAYYTSTVFEAFDREGDLRSLFGGGRYDELVGLFGGPPTPAVGLAIGDQTLELLLRAHGRWPDGEPGLDTYVVAVTPEQLGPAFEWVQRLRRAGVSADCDLMARSLSRQLKEAARRRARRALLLGPQEAARGVVLERDLATGAQRERSPEEVLPKA
jgi:histidyl-tRNA synthetase